MAFRRFFGFGMAAIAVWVASPALSPLWGQGFGGDRGGGGDRGDRGGFDPSAFLDRLDRNGNGMLDMDEREGPAGFIIGRLQRENPNFKVDRPIPLKEIRDSFDRMRGGGGDSSGGDSRGGGDSNDSPSALSTELLVPGFGEPDAMVPVPGFGAAAELFDVEIRPEDEREADERMRRYDRNRDGFLTSDELSSRWEGNPMDFDRNKDGKLSTAELAVRYARRREGASESRDTGRDSRNDRGRDRRREEAPADPYNGAKSFRNLGVASDGEIPELFKEKDTDGDRQVTMSEFTSEWSEEKVKEFYALDDNKDGVVTLREFQTDRSGAGSGGESSASSSRDSRSSMSRGDSSSSRSSSSGGSSSSDNEKLAKYLDYSKRIIARSDANKDGVLDAEEWKKMLTDPSGADSNKDGKITADEYAKFLLEKSKK